MRLRQLGRVGLVRVSGRSMLPTLRDGDLLLVRHGAPVRSGALVVADLPDRGLAVKRATHRVPEGWWLERDNPSVGTDSWLIGAVPESAVRSVVLARLWPPPSCWFGPSTAQ